MRGPQVSVLALFAAFLVPASCSLAVSTELDKKPPEGPPASGTDAGTVDAPSADATNEVEISDAPHEPDALEIGPDTSSDAGCDTCPKDCCEGICTDLANDQFNCGQCGHACPAERACKNGECQHGFVSVRSNGAPSPRRGPCAVWTGSEMFVWGGEDAANTALGTGAAYDPMKDTWREIAEDGDDVPDPRGFPTCVAMDGKVFVWGGSTRAPSSLKEDGAIWDPTSNSWSEIATDDAPAPRVRPVAVWTGVQVLIWGGEKLDEHQEPSGGLYDPVKDEWVPMSTNKKPENNKRQAWAWTGSVLYVFGGRDDGGGHVTDRLHSYSPQHDAWEEVDVAGAPSPRSNAFAAWTGSRLIIWGGLANNTQGQDDGASFDPLDNAWTPAGGNAPLAGRGREQFRSGWNFWTGDAFLIAGGSAPTTVFTDLATHYPEASPNGAWSDVSEWNPPVQHDGGVAVWSGQELILWGGFDGSDPIVNGTRWMP